MKNFILFSIIVLLSSCMAKPKDIDKEEIKDYKLIGYDPPKHFHVDLQDVQTGKIYRHVYVSKHCNNHREFVIGNIYKLKRIYYTREGTEISQFDDLYESFCQ